MIILNTFYFRRSVIILVCTNIQQIFDPTLKKKKKKKTGFNLEAALAAEPGAGDAPATTEATNGTELENGGTQAPAAEVDRKSLETVKDLNYS